MKQHKSSVDFKEVAALALDRAETLVPQWLPGGKRSGAEWVCGGLSGEPGRSLSVNLNTGVWSDFATGDSGGDLIRLLAAIRGCDQPTAAAEIDPSLARSLNGNGNGHRPAPASSAARKPAADWVPIIPVPDSAPEPPAWLFSHKEHGPAAASWPYRTRDGGLIGHILRFNQADGGKEFRPVTWCEGPDGKQEWRAKAFPEPRVLYGLELLHRDGPVYIVEGEKSADALRRLLPEACVLSWPGGSNAVSKADWSVLAGRDVVVWPDADPPGLAAALGIQKVIPGAWIAKPPADKPKGWDAADAEAEGWTADNAREFLARPAAEEQDPDRAPAADRHYSMPFRLLGISGEKYVYLPDSSLMVIELAASAHTKLNLMRLAPLQDWEAEFPTKTGVDWDAAANALLQRSAVLPKFDPSRLRGRGCWIDGEDVVFHAGGHLVVNGVTTDLRHYNSTTHVIYAGNTDIPTHNGHPATDSDGVKFHNACGMLPWEHPISGVLLAGGLYMAIVCGVLSWRPHLWISGPAGSGKSWTAGNIIFPILGKVCLSLQGASTEAGIRGKLGQDARPVLIDEAESDDEAGAARMGRIIELARQSSSGTGGGIVKGTQTGGSVEYSTNALFILLSIGTAAVKKADTSRITVLNLRKSDDRENFERLQELCRETAGNPEWAASIRARAVGNAMTIRRNAEVFSAAAVQFTGDKRMADQMGTLLAGAWSLMHSGGATLTDAQEYLSRHALAGFRPVPEDLDENRCYSHLMDSMLTLDRGERTPVGELMEKAAQGDADANAVLKRWGMKVHEGREWFANRHALLGTLFKGTQWAGEKWAQQLARMPGARREPPSKFGHKCTQRAVSIDPQWAG